MVAIIVVIELALFKISFASKLVSNRQLYNYCTAVKEITF